MNVNKLLKAIVIIDDDPILQDVYEIILQKEGYQSTHIKDIEDFNKRVNSSLEYDFIMIDYYFASITAEQIIKKLSEDNPNWNPRQALVISSLSQDSSQLKDIKNKYQVETSKKPLNAVELLSTIDTIKSQLFSAIL